MKPVSIIAAGLVTSALLAGVAGAQTQYVRYSVNGGDISWGVLEGSTIHQLSDAPYLDGTRTGRTVERSGVKLEAPVDPKLVLMTAFNFRSHISGEPAEYPGMFIVPSNSIVGPEDPIVMPGDATSLHYEAELVSVVGKRAENVSLEDAPDYIFGVTAGNDVSERVIQSAEMKNGLMLIGKSFDTFCPLGPVIATDLDPANLKLSARLNGETRQEINTSDLLFSVARLVSYVSEAIQLLPGDVILTGTPSGVGPMQPGDVVEIEISGIGVLRNPVIREE